MSLQVVVIRTKLSFLPVLLFSDANESRNAKAVPPSPVDDDCSSNGREAPNSNSLQRSNHVTSRSYSHCSQSF